MAVDKLVDSAALGNALGYTASRIRAKTGSSSLIPFDLEHGLGFGDAVDAIPSGGGGVPSTSAYIQTGLIHLWDAIETEADADSPIITVWKDLVGSTDLTPNSANCVWGRDSFIPPLDNKAFCVAAPSGETISQSAAPTVEIVLSPYNSTTMYCFYIGQPLRQVGIFSDNTVSTRGQSDNTYDTGLQSLEDLRSIACVYDQNASTGRVFVNGAECQKGSKTHNFSGDYDSIRIGHSTSTQYRPNFFIHCIRIYDRQLSAAEIEANYAVDVQRFFTNSEAVTDILLGGV